MTESSEDARRLTDLVDQFLAKRNISRVQYRQLSEIVLADGSIDEYERQQINRLHDAIKEGMVKVMD